MGVSWTKEQQNVIDFRDRNILVSAAAGSGKTAVLVERIIKRITDPKNPVDIDRILVVTFTKAAASEMRERIGDAIAKKKVECSDDENLDRQMTLIHNAQITTIDSFCLFVVRNHFEEINLDPDFRIADTGEITLLEQDVLDEVFEKNYAKEDNEAFINLINAYSGKRSDQNVRDMVSKIYRMSASDSWPREWIEKLTLNYKVTSVNELLNTEIMREITEYTLAMLKEHKTQLEALLEITQEADGPTKYGETIEKDLTYFEEVDNLSDYKSIYNFFGNLSMGNIAVLRKFEGDVQKKEAVKNGRNTIKDELKKLREDYFSMDLDELIQQLKRMEPYTTELIRLSLEYIDTIDLRKREKRIVDFSDIEHFALRILVDEKTKECRATAEAFRNHFDEIMIDEYQDSNQVQEDIMCAISRECINENNMFMVGDVKQSIYRFRLARPELFMDKYNRYDVEESKNQRIDLHKNFRSRQEVVDFSNDIFFKIMHTDLGNVTYDDDAALYCGAEYPENDGMKAEVILFDKKDESIEESNDIDLEEGMKKIEARMVADRINRLMKETYVTDKKTRELRKMRYSDIVILFRSLKDWGTDFANILEDCGIPAHVESSTGYFSSYEIQTVLNMLRILDNPFQDIPMAAVLKSPIVGLDDEEMAEIRVENQDVSFSMAAFNKMEEAEEGALYNFYQSYTKLRSQVADTPIHELIQHILDETGFGEYAASMPAGERRSQNISMLLEKAISYEMTSYKGLFHFVRYIDQLQKYDVDFGEAEVLGENADVVHIMTIHKSKGLEFPVVFVSGMGKKINQRDSAEAMVLHPDLGLGIEEMTSEPRTKRKCILKSEIGDRIRRENLGEELRVLYVALTRAKEKLILTGVISDKEKTIGKFVGNTIPKVPISFSQRVKAGSYLDWVIPAVISYPNKYEINYATVENIATSVIEDMAIQGKGLIELKNEIQSVNDELINELTKQFDFEYKYKSEAGRKSKYSVSELKHDSMLQNYDNQMGEAEIPEFLLKEKTPFIPEFARKPVLDNLNDEARSSHGMSRASLRGTAVHRVMECLDFEEILNIDVADRNEVKKFIKLSIDNMVNKDEITEEMRSLVSPYIMERFVVSSVAKRMAEAAKRGELFKEKPFVMDYEGVLVQGIIDVFWFEGDNIILLDYKTDNVKESQELVIRYQKQLELYADAVTRLFDNSFNNKRASEKLIYSFRLQEEIKL